MRKGDLVLYYHSVTEKQVVGVAKVDREHYPDPTAEAGEGDWSCVDLVPFKPLKAPVSLEAIKGDAVLREIPLVRQSRLSVTPMTPEQYARVIELGGLRG
jgi:predicted RNA-binding protein with PUA-like domain